MWDWPLEPQIWEESRASISQVYYCSVIVPPNILMYPSDLF